MSVGLEEMDVRSEGNSLSMKLKCDLAYLRAQSESQISEHRINDIVAFSAKVEKCAEYKANYFVSFRKLSDNELTYSVRFVNTTYRSNLYNLQKNYTVDDSDWRLLLKGIDASKNYIFKVSIVISIIVPVKLTSGIQFDSEMTDFELRGEDGSVHMHKVIAAAASSVIKTSLSQEWGKGDNSARDAPPHTTLATLQHLKRYIYFDTLPDSGLEELLLLASFYIMPDLERRCIYNLVQKATVEEAHNLIEFALKYKNKHILFEIMGRVEDDHFDADKIKYSRPTQ